MLSCGEMASLRTRFLRTEISGRWLSRCIPLRGNLAGEDAHPFSSLPISIQSREAEDNQNWSCTALCLRPVSVLTIDFSGVICHRWPCMLLNVRCTLFSNPTLSAIFFNNLQALQSL